MASSAFSLAAAAAKIQTVAQVRAAMGAVTTTLSQGYAVAAQLADIADVRTTALSLLDTVNKSATILYNIYSDDPEIQDEDISASHAHSAGVIISEANDALKTIEDVQNQNLFDIASIVTQAVQSVGSTVGEGLQAVTNAVVAGGTAFVWAAWPTLLLVGAGLTAYVFRRRLLAAIGKATG
jgi:hypothetical protein